jgi:hypothetical protein
VIKNPALLKDLSKLALLAGMHSTRRASFCSLGKAAPCKKKQTRIETIPNLSMVKARD